jgi:uncharacterized protein (DUF1697 family)
MPIYIVMLRGVNVAKTTMKMESLRSFLQSLGCCNVKTYVQSGNAVLESKSDSGTAVSKKIEDGMQVHFGFRVPVLLRSVKELKEIVRANPFTKQKSVDQSKLHVTFLSNAPEQSRLPGLDPLAAKTERFFVGNKEIYLYCPDGYGRTKLSNAVIEKKLSVTATTRNWRTVNALLEMAR